MVDHVQDRQGPNDSKTRHVIGMTRGRTGPKTARRLSTLRSGGNPVAAPGTARHLFHAYAVKLKGHLHRFAAPRTNGPIAGVFDVPSHVGASSD
jgi:hypothetical protein